MCALGTPISHSSALHKQARRDHIEQLSDVFQDVTCGIAFIYIYIHIYVHSYTYAQS